jgi:hypothetical protein
MLWVKQIEQGRKQIISNLDLIDGLVLKKKVSQRPWLPVSAVLIPV